MSNGRHALKGFEYQAIVNLDLILEYFHESTNEVEILPEDEDDLVIIPIKNNKKHFFQIKKPKEYDNSELKDEPWSLEIAVQDLLTGTYCRLKGNDYHQTWILGDRTTSDLDDLLKIKNISDNKFSIQYLTAIHLLAREYSKIIPENKSESRTKLINWKPNKQSSVADVITDFIKSANGFQIDQEKCKSYEQFMQEIGSELPDILTRISVKPTYGRDEEIIERIQKRLSSYTKLDWEIIKKILVPGLRNYVYNISSQIGKKISKLNFEEEIRIIWPRMTLVCDPPKVDDKTLQRSSLIENIFQNSKQGSVEITGISGSGKTTIASELINFTKNIPNLHAFYVELKLNDSFRDVLAGIAFHLRRIGFSEFFPLVTRYFSSDERALSEMAELINISPLNILLIIDLVDGICSVDFANNIAKFLDKLHNKLFRFIILGQESSFRMLSDFRRVALNLPPTIDIPGFNFEEFLSLYKLIHSKQPDRTELWGIFNSLTANRQSGLYALLANRVARSKTLLEMKRLVDLEPNEIIEKADKKRYDLISKEISHSVDKLLCFILPFREDEAVNIFPKDRIKEAIKEATRFGLLRKLDNNRYEFHETVRKGLIEYIAPSEYASTNRILAEYYLQSDDIITSIFHLEKAGDIEASHKTARNAFLEGNHRNRLHAYITKNRLIDSSEIINLLNREIEISKYYMLPDMLKHIGDKNTALELLEIVKNNSERFDKDFQWAWKIVEAIVICDPTCLYELVIFGLKQTKPEKGNDRLEWVIQGIRRPTTPIIDDRLVHFFNKQTKEIKRRLIPLLLLDKRRKILIPAFSFLDSLSKSAGHNEENEQALIKNINLRFTTPDEICEFLASIPVPENIPEMLKNKSVLLGIFEKYIWRERNVLQPQCIEILNNPNIEVKICLNALRVLTFLQDDFAVNFAEHYSGNESIVNIFCSFLPVFFKNAINLEKYRVKVFDTNLPMEERIVAFYILCNTNENIDSIIEKLITINSSNTDTWKYIIVMNSLLCPCKSAIPLFEKMLNEPDANSKLSTLAPLVTKFGELPGKDVVDFLIRMLRSPWKEIKFTACMSLLNRRSKLVLPDLFNIYHNKSDSELRQIALVAAIASGPENIDSFAAIWDDLPNAAIWRCILAGRLQSVSEAKWLIKTATDQKGHWQVRRAAILAICSLPFDVALKKIYKSVLKEKSSFYIDDNSSLTMHSILASLIISEGQGFFRYYLNGKESFVKLWGDIFSTLTNDTFYPITKERGNIYAEWLYDRLTFHGWPKEKNALDIIYNELHVPILQAAIIRGLRLTGKRYIIEKIIIKADMEWLLSRCLCEWFKKNERRTEDILRIKKYLSKSLFSKSISANNIIKKCSEKKEKIYNTNHKSIENNNQLFCLNYDETIKILETDQNPGKTQYKLIDLTKVQFMKLVSELDPNNDYETKEILIEPKLEFSQSGPLIRQVKHVSTNNRQSLREALRTALVAANNFGIDIPWHLKLISGIRGNNIHEHAAEKYSTEYLKNIAEQGDSKFLYDGLEQYGDLIIERLGKILYIDAVKSLIDEKIIPYLRIYANAGTDNMLESLCSLALCIENEEIDSVLAELFLRWYNRFDRSDQNIQHYGNHSLWKAFTSLRKHPRLKNVPDYDLRLLEILNCNIYWIYRDDIISTIKDSPRCYIKIEQILMKATPFEHRLWDEVDNLDEIAQKLFNQTID